MDPRHDAHGTNRNEQLDGGHCAVSGVLHNQVTDKEAKEPGAPFGLTEGEQEVDRFQLNDRAAFEPRPRFDRRHVLGCFDWESACPQTDGEHE
jgi:hypothetical protein